MKRQFLIAVVVLIVVLLILLTAVKATEVDEVTGIATRYQLSREVVLPDKTRVDILAADYAIEVDWSEKWAEGIGQSLYYGLMTNRKPGVLLLKKADTSTKLHEEYLDRCEKVCRKHEIALWSADEGSTQVKRIYPVEPFQ